MRKLYLVIVLSMVALLAVGAIAIERNHIRPEGTFNLIEITKTYDLYGVLCTSGPCQEEGKCLGTIGDWTRTCLTLCGLKFDVGNTEYWVYNVPEGVEPEDAIKDPNNEIGKSVNGVYEESCLTKGTDYGRVRYHLAVYAKNDARTPSKLIDATLCLATEVTHNDAHYVGSDCEQVAEVYGGEPVTEVVLPEPTNKDIGQNVILCPIECDR
jgi:hypothetical protein